MRKWRKGKELTFNEIKDCLTLHLNGVSVQDISRKYCISTPRMRKILVDNGAKIKIVKYSEVIRDKLADLYENSNKSFKEILYEVNVTSRVLCSVIKERNLIRKNPPKRKGSKTGPRFSKDNNPMKGTNLIKIWTEKYGKEQAEIKMTEMKQKQSKNSSGSNNPMYGKSTPQGAGNGWKGWFKDHYFRSLRELMFMIETDRAGINWSNGEKITIKYIYRGTQRTYKPDFIIGNKIYEIKPLKLQNSPNVLAKKEAAEKYCRENGMEYILVDKNINNELMFYALSRKMIKWAGDYKLRYFYKLYTKAGFLIDTTYEQYKEAHKHEI